MANEVKKAIRSINAGDVRGLKKNIQEALVAKVRKALTNKEKQIAKSLIEAAAKSAPTKVVIQGDAQVTTKQKSQHTIKFKYEDTLKDVSSADAIWDEVEGSEKAFAAAEKEAKKQGYKIGKGEDVDTASPRKVVDAKTGKVYFNESFGSETLKEAKYFTVMATSDIPTKDDSKLVARDGQTILVASKQELAKKLKTSVKDLFVNSDHEKLFDSLAAQGKMPYVYVDPYDGDINNTFSLGVAASRKEAEKQERDSAGDI